MKKIIAYCMGGFANRINCLLTCMEIAKRQDRELLVFWDETEFGCGIAFNEIYKNQIPLITSKELELIEDFEIFTFKRSIEANQSIYERNDLALLERKKACNEDFSLIRDSNVSNIIYHNYMIDEPQFKVDSIYDKKSILDNMKELVLVDKLSNKIDDFVREYGIDKSVFGAHIRATDFNSHHIVPYKKYDYHISCDLQGERLFLMSDSLPVEEMFAKRYSNIIVRKNKTYPKKIDEGLSWEKNIVRDRESVMDSIIDFYISTKTNLMLYDSRSTFGRLAYDLSINE